MTAPMQVLDRSAEPQLGAVYTPAALAAWLAREVVSRLPATEPIRILDPACGDGALLRAVEGLSSNRVHLIGTDVDVTALATARGVLGRGAMLECADALAPAGPKVQPVVAWESMLGAGPLSGVVANPPWGADVVCEPAVLRELGYHLATGQFDSYELFVELCIALVPDGAVLGFIVPDSVFLPQHTRLRRMLLASTRLELVARLGEGIFPGIFRGTTVMVARKGRADPEHRVGCLRLNRAWRLRILAGTATYEQAKDVLMHEVPQARFAADREARFDIDVSDSEVRTYAKLHGTPRGWADPLRSGRGVELSKHGHVIICPGCGEARPRPRNGSLEVCRSCGTGLGHCGTITEQIIRVADGASAEGWTPLIVGEDVDRYHCGPSRWIRTGLPGINYKDPEQFEGRKLLIRKTGVGLKAAIDETGAYTTQVVFHYLPERERGVPDFYLDYLLGVLCSRTLLAYHLKRLGEGQWRSHPYITQSVLAELPIPSVEEGNWSWTQARAIAAAAQRRRSARTSAWSEDLRVEGLVAGLYGLDDEDCEWVLRVLDEAEPLEPIRTLRLSPGERLNPVRI